jgi:hypothetical protein
VKLTQVRANFLTKMGDLRYLQPLHGFLTRYFELLSPNQADDDDQDCSQDMENKNKFASQHRYRSPK